MIEDSGMNRSSWSKKAAKMDKENKAAFVKREQKRKTIKEAEEFANFVMQFTL